MSRPPDQPAFKPSFCFNQTALRDFLRLSRAGIDDTILQNLNALSTPSSVPFDPLSTRSRQTSRGGSGSERGSRGGSRGSRVLDARTCADFRTRVLFPAWAARSDLLEFCERVAAAPDPDAASGEAKAAAVVVDERMDPYGARNWPRQEARTEALAMLVRNERRVESIIRARTWGLVGERCEEEEGDEGRDADAALKAWREREGL